MESTKSLCITRQVIYPKRHLPFKRRVLPQSAESPAAPLPLQHTGRCMRPLDSKRVHGGSLGRNVHRPLESLRQALLPEGARSCERRVLGVERHRDAALLVALLLAFEADGEGAAHGVGKALAGFPEGQEAVAHPAAGCAVAADVAEAALVVAVGSAEGYFFYRLVHYQALCFVLYDAEAVAAYVEDCADWSSS